MGKKIYINSCHDQIHGEICYQNAGQENTSYTTTQLDLVIGFKMLVVLIDVYLKKEKEKVPKQRYKYNLNKLRFVDIMSSLHLNNTISFSS